MRSVPARWLRRGSFLGVLGGMVIGAVLVILALRHAPPESLQAGPPASTAGAPGQPSERGPDTSRSVAVQVLTFYPGMSAATMEKTITNRVERWCNQAPGVRRVESRSIAGASSVRVYFGKDADRASALTQVSSLALSALPSLPPNTLPPLVLALEPDPLSPLGMVTLGNPTMNEAELKDVARSQVRNLLRAVDGCSAPIILGGKERSIVIYLDPRKLEAHKLAPQDVLAALQKDRPILAPGTVHLGTNQIQLTTEERFDPARLNVLPIKTDTNGTVFLRDLGQAEDAYAIQTQRVRVDGRRTVCVPVFTVPGSHPAALRRQLTQRVPKMEARLPRGTQLGFVPFVVERNGGDKDDTGLVRISVRAPSNLQLDESEKRVLEIERLLQAQVPASERLAIISQLGLAPDLSIAFTHNEGQQDATIYLQLAAERRLSAREYAGRLRHSLAKAKEMADLHIRVDADGREPPLAVRISGGDVEASRQQARAIRDHLARVPGAVDVGVVQRLDAPALVINVDRVKSAAVGLSTRDVTVQAVMALNAGVSVNGNPSSLTVQYPEDPGRKLEEALDVPVLGTNQGRAVKLGSLVSLRRVSEPVAVDHVNLQRVFTVEANVADRAISDVARDIKKLLQELRLPEALSAELEIRALHTGKEAP